MLLLRPRGADGNGLVPLCLCLSRPWGVHSHLPLLRLLPLLLLRRCLSSSSSVAPGAVMTFCCIFPDLHLCVERLGDVIELMVIHVGEGSLHVAHEPANGMLGHPLPAPRGRFCRMCSHVIVPGTNPWSSPAHGHLSLLREDQSLPGRVSGSFSAHALSPGLALIAWKACPVAAWAFFPTSTSALLSGFPSGL